MESTQVCNTLCNLFFYKYIFKQILENHV